MVNHFNKSKSQRKIVVAMDSFKGSLTSLEAGNAVRDGILEKYPDFDVQIFPVADGGEGTVEALTFGKEHVQTRTISVTGPVGTEVSAGYTIYEQAGKRRQYWRWRRQPGYRLYRKKEEIRCIQRPMGLER